MRITGYFIKSYPIDPGQTRIHLSKYIVDRSPPCNFFTAGGYDRFRNSAFDLYLTLEENLRSEQLTPNNPRFLEALVHSLRLRILDISF